MPLLLFNHFALVLKDGPRQRAASESKLQRIVLASVVLGGIVEKPPLALKEWRRTMLVSRGVLKLIRAPGLTGEYMMPWTLRGALCTGLARTGQTLSKRGASVSDALAVFPDSSDWTKRLAGTWREHRMQGLLKHLHYRGKLENFAMHLCFAASPTLDAFAPEDIVRKRRRLKELLATIRRRDGMNPTPATCLLEARAAGIL